MRPRLDCPRPLFGLDDPNLRGAPYVEGPLDPNEGDLPANAPLLPFGRNDGLLGLNEPL